MKCKRVRELMGPYVYGDLTPREMMEVRLHAQECERCAHDLSTRGETVDLLANTPPALSDEEKQSIVWSVKGAVRARQDNRTVWLRPATAAGLAGMLVVGFCAGAFVTSRLDRSPPPRAAAKVQITELQSPDDTAESSEFRESSEPRAASGSGYDRDDERQERSSEPRYRHRRAPMGGLPLAATSPSHRSRRVDTRDESTMAEEPLKVVPSPEENEPAGGAPEPKKTDEAVNEASEGQPEDTADVTAEN